ncbi:InlB B-repeat-containing protein [Paenibacillus sp. ACRRY]|uniref:InlB B-repeat-containing protein n=1 Tax=Paenibacillus sp. ACRRY TaxID=2918208 RepID=UPI001EF6BA0A|nr:InlB B-repeat-containing protein [Paenibacillus sp. ACRRY]
MKKVSIIWLVFLIGLSGLWNNSSIFERAQAAGAEPYLGEIRLFPYNAIPKGWMPARGQSMSVTQNTALYSLLGLNFGGDGRTTFSLPNLSGSAPDGMGYYIAINGIYPSREESLYSGAESVLGEVRLFPYQFTPPGWLALNGQEVSTSTYSDLFQMIGTTYGGDGNTTFKLPTMPKMNDIIFYAISTDPTLKAENGTGYEYIGEIIPMLVSLPTNRWIPANGLTLPINQNQPLFSLFGTKFGGDGRVNFNVPNLNSSQSALVYYVANTGVFPSLDGGELPEAIEDNYIINQNTTLVVSAPGVLSNDRAASAAMLRSGPMNGTVVMNSNGSFAYTPVTDYVGTDSFTYSANNQWGTSIPVAVTITIEQTTAPIVSGVTEGGTYNQAVTPRFNSGTAILNGSAFTSGTTVTADGDYTLAVTNSIGTTTIHFTVDTHPPIVTGVTQDGVYNVSPFITFNEGTATLNGFPFNTGDTVQAEGEHVLIVTDRAGNTTTVQFSFHVPRTIHFDSNGGSEVPEQNVNYGDKTNEPDDPTKAGHTFAGWFTDSGFSQAFDFDNTTVTSNLTLYAKWSINSYTVNFNSSGGTAVDDQSVPYSELAAAPDDPTKDGHTFAGWFTDSGLSQAFDFDNTPVTGDITLYAKWTINSYTVNFDSNGGTAVDDQSIQYGELATTPDAPAKAGHTFLGWFTDSSLSQAFDFDNTTVNGDMTLYAKWSINSYTVNFDSNGGTAVDDQSVPYNELAMAPADPTNVGHTFAGWFTDSGLSLAFDFDNTPVTGDLTLYAKWLINSYTVNFNSNGGTAVDDQSIQYNELAVAPVDPTKVGHTFAGWFTDSSLSQAFNFDNTPVTTDLTLYAKWSINSYTVSFNSNGGTAIDEQSIQYGGLAVAPADPTNVGHTFAGWFTDSALSQAFDFDNTTVTSDLTLYAKWTADKYTISFDTLGGSTVDDISIEHGSKLTTPASPSRSGYTFAGWYRDPELKTPFDFDQTEIIADLTLYAKWNVIPSPPSGGNGSNSGGSGSQNNTGSSSSSNSSSSTNSTNGRLTLAAGQAGQVSLGDGITLTIPAGAMNQELKITIDQVKDSSDLLTNQAQLLSPVYEILKNVSQNFIKPVTLKMAFDGSSLRSNQRPELFYFDEQDKTWHPAGESSIVGNQIQVDIDHFTKFAVFAVDQPNAPVEAALQDIQGHWAEKLIQQAARDGIVKGYVDGSFKPNASVTRAEFTVMLMNALQTSYTEAPLSFTDRSNIGAWAQSAVARAVQAGFIQGGSDGTFRPNDAVTRAEMAVMVANALQLKAASGTSSTFADDGQIPVWARAAVAGMQKSGLLNGKGLNTFAPRDNTTRAESVKLLLSMQN